MFSIVYATVCQHLHQLCVVTTVGNDAGKAGNRSKRPDKGSFVYFIRNGQTVRIGKGFARFQVIIFYKP